MGPKRILGKIVPVSFLLIILSLTVNAVLDQTYVQIVRQNGDSVIAKDMDLGLYAGLLPPGAFQRMSDICAAGFKVPCSVDATNKTIHMEDTFTPNDGYYSFTADYGFPSTRYTLTVNRIPTDRFGYDLDSLLTQANASGESQGGTIRPLDLNLDNTKAASLIQKFGSNITYSIRMPGNIETAPEGKTTQNSADYDLVFLMGRQGPVTIISSELNIPYIIIALAAIVVAALAVSFMGTEREKSKEEKAPAKKKRS